MGNNSQKHRKTLPNKYSQKENQRNKTKSMSLNESYPSIRSSLDNYLSVNNDHLNIANNLGFEIINENDLLSKEEIQKNNNNKNNITDEDNLVDITNRKRTYSKKNIFEIKENVYKPHPNSEIFENIDIFNSILIMLNNISFINTSLEKIDEPENIFKKIKIENPENILLSIVYHMNKYLWDKKFKFSKCEGTLFNNYKRIKEFCLKKYNQSNENIDKFFKDFRNVKIIIEFILNTLNNELTLLNDDLNEKINEIKIKNKKVDPIL